MRTFMSAAAVTAVLFSFIPLQVKKPDATDAGWQSASFIDIPRGLTEHPPRIRSEGPECLCREEEVMPPLTILAQAAEDTYLPKGSVPDGDGPLVNRLAPGEKVTPGKRMLPHLKYERQRKIRPAGRAHPQDEARSPRRTTVAQRKRRTQIARTPQVLVTRSPKPPRVVLMVETGKEKEYFWGPRGRRIDAWRQFAEN